MKFRDRFYLLSSLISLTMVGVVMTEIALWNFNRRQHQVRNYVTTCLKDVFELNLLTHELNFFQDSDRPLDQMELKLRVLTGRFWEISAADAFSLSEREAIKSILHSMSYLIEHIRVARTKTKLPEKAINQQEFEDRISVQLLQRSQTLYGAFSQMRQRIVKKESQNDFRSSVLRAFTLALLCLALIFNSFLLQRRIRRSLMELELGAREVVAGNKDFLFPQMRLRGEGDEIDAVKDAFNRMLTSLKSASHEIQKKNQELETLLYVISHDLKEPLRSIEYFSSAVRDRYAQALAPEAQDYLSRVIKSAVRMRHLFGDLLALSRARKVALAVDWVSTNEIVKGALERLEHRIHELGASVKVIEDLPDLKVDPTWFQEVVYNLVGNALKYVRPGEKPQIEILSYRAHEIHAGELGIIVRDRGPGVPSEMRERIFGLFQRGVGHEVEGTGAGLAIVKTVVEQHGGQVWVDERDGGGAEFFISFKF